MSLWEMTDLELIDHYRSLAPGWSEVKRRVHDALARRVRAKGRIVHGGRVYVPTDDESFACEAFTRASNYTSRAGGSVGRQLADRGSQGRRVIRSQSGHNPDQEWWWH